MHEIPAPASRIAFEDPYVKSTRSEIAAGTELVFPEFEASALRDSIPALKARAREVFARMSLIEIQEQMDGLDAYFADTARPEIQSIIDLVHRVDGFSRHDIERFGLGIFPPLVAYDRRMIGRFVKGAFDTRHTIETAFGYLRRFGSNSPFLRWREPGLLSHFVSGNVVGYSAILTRIGLPVKDLGAAQIIKLPSTSAVFPMIYLTKMAEVAPEVRETMACGYWKGGDREIEGSVLANSDVINILGSEATIQDVSHRAQRLRPVPMILAHGHKVGAAYISRAFAERSDRRERVIAGLTRDISAFDGGACYCTKNVYVQGDHRAFAEELAGSLTRFASEISPVNHALKPIGRELARVFDGAPNVIVSGDADAVVRISDRLEFWFPEEAYRYVQVMPAGDARVVAGVLRGAKPYLQTVVMAVPDEEILSDLELFGNAGASNLHYPGSAPLLNVYEEPHDGDFDFIKARYPYKSRFAATNFKRNSDWLK